MEQDEKDLKETLEKILAQRQGRLGLSQEEAQQDSEEPPLFLEAAEERAREAGCDLDELLVLDLQKIRDVPYPGPDCLRPDEVMAYFETKELPAERLSHTRSCPECCTLLASAAQPPRLRREQPSLQAPRRRSAPPAWSPALLAACLLLAIGLWKLFRPLVVPSSPPAELARIVVLSPELFSLGQEEEAGARWAGATCSQIVTAMLSGVATDRQGRHFEVVPWKESAGFALASADRELRTLDLRDRRRLSLGFHSDSFVRCSGQAGPEGVVRLTLEIAKGGHLEEKSFEVPGQPSQRVSELAFDAGRWAIEELGVGEDPAESRKPYRYAMPSDAEALRFYSLGLAHLAEHRPNEATRWLDQAIQREEHPMAYAALSEAWSQLGDTNRERKFAQEAFQTAALYSLPEFESKALGGRYSEAFGKWEDAIQLYSELERISPNPVGSSIRLAEAHLGTSDARSAVAKIEELRQSVPSLSPFDSARLDLLESRAAEILSDPDRQRQAALRAAWIGKRLEARQLEAEASLLAGRAARVQEEHEEAEKLFARAESLFQEIGDANGSTAVLQERGVSAWLSRRDAERAERFLGDALRRYQELGNLGGVASVQIKLGHLDDELHGRSEEARSHYQNALRIFDEELGNGQGVSQAHLSLGILSWQSRDFFGAESHFTAALQGFQKISDRSGEARVLSNYGQLLFERGQIRDAQETLERSLKLRQETGLRRDEAASHVALAEVIVYKGDLSDAEEHYNEALAIYREIYDADVDNSPEAAKIRLRRTVVWLEQRRLPEAEAEIQKLLDLYQEYPKTLRRQDFELVRAYLRLLQGKPAEAMALLLPIPRDEARREYEREVLAARIELAMGQNTAAAARLEPIIETTRKEQLVLTELEARLALAEARLTSQKDAARQELQEIESRAEEMGSDFLSRRAAALLDSDGGLQLSIGSLFPPLLRALER